MIDYKIDKVVTDNFLIPYIRFGNGNKNLVVIPGMSFLPISENPDGFVNQFSRFSNEYTVYLFDRKEDMSDSYYIQDMANDTLSAIKFLELKNIYLYGASQGGMIAQLITLKYPKLIKKLVLASTSYYISIQSSEVFDQMIYYCDKNKIKELIEYCLSSMYSQEFLLKNKESILNFYSKLSLEQIHQYKIQCNAYNKIYLLNDLEKIKVPTMILASMKDKIFNYEDSLLITSKLNCDCVIYDDYSHCVYDEAPDFTERLYHFFSK